MRRIAGSPAPAPRSPRTLTERCFYSLDAPAQRLAGLDIPTPYNGALEAATIPQIPDIVAAARALHRFHASNESSLTMSHPITMPALSDTMSNGRLVKWTKQPGDVIKKGEVVAEIETDKAVMEVEAFEDGYLSGPLAEEGTEAPVGQVIGYIAESVNDVAKVAVQTSPLHNNDDKTGDGQRPAKAAFEAPAGLGRFGRFDRINAAARHAESASSAGHAACARSSRARSGGCKSDVTGNRGRAALSRGTRLQSA